ncbi:hypothetical protein OG568_60795 (plasmid) [Streptomyces sp. NBC_01450]|uniref:hypothetical protein n=1 Tax=Streptomyces sp. NBC_01450 TaxID=2903871 RepID=UPI002E3316FC|nr:hypothetical protein [Streptomyces sp. NBC_01450]
MPKIPLSNGLWTRCKTNFAGVKFSNGDPLDNNVSSVVNNSGSALFSWETAPDDGQMFGVPGGHDAETLGSFDNKTSSAC